MVAFIAHLNSRYPQLSLNPQDYWQLYKWSVEEIETFWKEVWDFCGIIGTTKENSCEVILQNISLWMIFLVGFLRGNWISPKFTFSRSAVNPDAFAVHFRAEIDSCPVHSHGLKLRFQVAKAQSLLVNRFRDREGWQDSRLRSQLSWSADLHAGGASIGAIFTAGSRISARRHCRPVQSDETESVVGL